MNEYIYLVVAPSGTGKTTIVEYLENKYGLKSIPSYTTRLPRHEGERGHTFVSQGEFNALKDMVAYTYFDNHEYCATAEQVEKNQFYVIDPDGIEFFKEKYHGNKTPIVVYLYADSVTRSQRMRGRGDEEKDVMQRLENDLVKFKNIEYDIKIDTENKSIEEVAEELYDYIDAVNDL